jgi:probable HAF family extracellular repeat protein
MKSRACISICAIALFTVLAMSVRLTAQKEQQEQAAHFQHYTVTDLGTLPGGTFSQATFVSNTGVVTGVATTADGAQHAVLWGVRGHIMDIATAGLGGRNSAALGITPRGQAAGGAESSTVDPNDENFCAYGTGLKCLPFLWQGGIMTQLPLLGGNNGAAGPINNRGEVAGIAENSTRDPECPSAPAVNGTGPQVLDFEAVIWGPKQSQIRELLPLSGDSVGMALWINNNGQAVGVSGRCANTIVPPIAVGPHAVLWEKDGSVHDLGSLGGTVSTTLLGVGNAALSVNNQGHVVGASALPGNTNNHAFLWTRQAGMRDLGTLPGYDNSAAAGINDRGDVVGTSYDVDFNLRAFLWQNGVMTDLNALVPASSPMFLLFATAINSRGDIVGFGVTSGGDVHAFLAVLCDRNHADSECCRVDGEGAAAEANESAERPQRVLSEDARGLLQQRLPFGRFGAPLTGPR